MHPGHELSLIAPLSIMIANLKPGCCSASAMTRSVVVFVKVSRDPYQSMIMPSMPAGVAKPGHEVGVDLCSCSRIEQRVQIDFADVGSAQISIRLRLERIPCAGVVGSLCLKSSSGLNE